MSTYDSLDRNDEDDDMQEDITADVSDDIDAIVGLIAAWDGKDVRVLEPVIYRAVDLLKHNNIDEYHRDELWRRVEDACANVDTGNWPDDLSNAFEFLIVDQEGRYLFRSRPWRYFSVSCFDRSGPSA